MKFDNEGNLRAINPEAGFFGVAPGTSMKSNPNAMLSCSKDTIFTNVALTDDGDVWWEGIGYDAPDHLIDWKGNDWKPGQVDADGNPVKAAHPNARFTARACNCPAIAPEWEDPAGVPIAAFLFGGRRPSTLPLIYQAKDWEHGVFIGSTVGSEVTAAALDVKAGTVRRDPFAMLPFCGYHMADYFAHWLKIGEAGAAKGNLPKIFCVNWFRKSPEGKFMWPGFGDNSRPLAWVFGRCAGTAEGVETAIGTLPTPAGIDLTGIEDEVSAADLEQLLAVDVEGWKAELAMIKEHYAKFGAKLPAALVKQLEALEARLG
jgi:phosphoenolpyruvate carboxykinase (GTP)